MADTGMPEMGAEQLQDGVHILAAEESPAMVLAIGFCASCCVPVTADRHVRKQVGEENLMFCSERCTTQYAPRDLFHW